MDGNIQGTWIQGTSAAALALSAHSSLNTLDWRLRILAISELCTFITSYPVVHVCHSLFQLILILKSACTSQALKHTSINWVKANKWTQLIDKHKHHRAVPVLLPGSPLTPSGPNLLFHVLCQIPASRTGTSFSTSLYNVLCTVTTARLS